MTRKFSLGTDRSFVTLSKTLPRKNKRRVPSYLNFYHIIQKYVPVPHCLRAMSYGTIGLFDCLNKDDGYIRVTDNDIWTNDKRQVYTNNKQAIWWEGNDCNNYEYYY